MLFRSLARCRLLMQFKPHFAGIAGTTGLLLTLTVPLLAQDAGKVINGHYAPHGIDGSQTPELIPDNVAYRFVFLSLMLPANPDQVALTKHHLRFLCIRLDGADEQRLETALTSFAAEYADWQHVVSYTPENDIDKRLSLGADRDSLVMKYRSFIAERLSMKGLSAFQAYVTREKQHMVY